MTVIQGHPLVSLRFHTQALDGGDRFEAWRQRVAGLYDVLPAERNRPPAFHMDTISWHLGQLIAGTAEFGAREQRRDARQIRADQVDHYRLTLLTAGRLQVDADGHRVAVQPGEILVTDMSRPETALTTEGRNVSVFVPREVLDEALPRPLDLHGHVPRGALAAMLADHLGQLARYLPNVGADEAGLLAGSTVQMIAAGLMSGAQTLGAARKAVETTLLRQACRYIELHLKDEDIGAPALCAALKLSRATLYRLFEPLGGVSSYIKERRLASIHELLAAPAERRPLALIAEDHGFKSAAHFSTAFRRQYGYSPSEVQARAAPPVALGAAGGSFDEWLRALR